jgi:hypothetical protein
MFVEFYRLGSRSTGHAGRGGLDYPGIRTTDVKLRGVGTIRKIATQC